MTNVRPVSGPPQASAKEPALKKVAEQFEAVFVRQMIASMRKAKLTDDPLDSSATDNFQELADSRTADSLSTGGHFGLAAMIERQLASKIGGAK